MSIITNQQDLWKVLVETPLFQALELLDGDVLNEETVNHLNTYIHGYLSTLFAGDNDLHGVTHNQARWHLELERGTSNLKAVPGHPFMYELRLGVADIPTLTPHNQNLFKYISST
jgi:hypothetical protein